MEKVFVIGGMKCGTSSVHHLLKKHFQVCVTTDKEPSFFTKRFKKGFDWYKNQFQPQPGNDVLIDVSPSYSMRHLYPNCTEEMHKYEPNAKIIYLVRDPFARIISHIHHDMLRGRLTTKDIDNWIKADADCLLTTKYFYQIKPYIDLYGKENIKVLQFEELIKSPQTFQDKVYDFIGLENIPAEIKPFNVSEKRYQIKYYDFIHGIFGKSIVSKGYHAIWYFINNKVEKPSLTDAQLKKIHELLQSDIHEFATAFQIDETLWKKWHSFS